MTAGVIANLHAAVAASLDNAFRNARIEGVTISPLSGDLREAETRLAVAWLLAENAPAAFAGSARSFTLTVTVQTKERDRRAESDSRNLDAFNLARDLLRDAFEKGTALTSVNDYPRAAGTVVEDLGEAFPENAAELDLLAIARSWTIAAA